MAKKKKIKNDINPDELHPAIKYGMPLENLGLLAWLNIFFVLGIYLILRSEGNVYIRTIFLGASIISVLSLIVSFFNEFIKKHQIFTYILIFLSSLNTILWMIFVGLAMYISEGVVEVKDFTPDRVRGYLIPVAILFILSTIVFVIYHQKKVVLKLNQGKALSYPISLGAIVSATVLGRHTSSSLSDTIAGIIGALLGAGLFPGGAVGALFCIIDLIKHPELKNNYE